MTLHSRMLIGFIAGVIAGLLAFYFGHGPAEAGELIGEKSAWLTLTITYVSGPVGEIFLKLLFMLVIPLVFSALVLGVVEIGDPKSLGRIGGRTLVYILSVSAIAAIIGMLAVNFFQPGVGIDSATAQELIVQDAEKAAVVKSKGEEASAMSVLMNIVPKNVVVAAYDNNLIAVMFFAMMFGIAAAVLRTEAVRSFLGAVQGIYEISIKLIGWVIEVAPFAVAALMFTMLASDGLGALERLVYFVMVAIGAMAFHMFVVFPIILKYFGKMSPLAFFKKAEPAILTAFSTSSSSATLPTTLEVAEHRLGMPARIGRFVCTLGATANMNGTALFEGVTVLFLAQYYGVDLSIAQQSLILMMCVLGGIGAAGVPGGSLPVIASILLIFNIPAEGIALILGVDRLLDMCRTSVNVTGDLVGTVVISQGEPELLQQTG